MTKDSLKKATEITDELKRLREILSANGVMALAKLYGSNPAKVMPLSRDTKQAVALALGQRVLALQIELKTL